MNYKIRYNPDEILQIFKEQHRLCGPLNSMVDTSFILTKNTLIREWQDALDLVNWKKLAHFFNKEFRIEESLETWNSVLNPDDKRTLGDLCAFIAKVAEKEVVNPIKILGTECFSASTFLTLKRNLKNKGVDVTNLRPSTKIEDFLDVDDNFSPLIEEITLTGVQVFDKLEYGKIKSERRYKYWIDKVVSNLIYKRSLTAGEVITFRDLVQKIIENKKLGEPLQKP